MIIMIFVMIMMIINIMAMVHDDQKDHGDDYHDVSGDNSHSLTTRKQRSKIMVWPEKMKSPQYF